MWRISRHEIASVPADRIVMGASTTAPLPPHLSPGGKEHKKNGDKSSTFGEEKRTKLKAM
jgi:hypothetical protein